VSALRPLRRIAIVNRGEAAVRCIRSIKSLRTREGSDLEALALFTDPDRDAPFVRKADLARELPSASGAVAAYLDHGALLEALSEAGADAVWPGWGFVAEDAVFVERLRDAGIRFLGPTPETMRSVGDKIAAKLLAERANVPVTAWSGRALENEGELREAAEKVGFPLVLKASAGGGGRGIRIVEVENQLNEAFRSARAEARAAFGDDRIFLESLVGGGRHIEVQIAGDSHGNRLSLGCRDCSVQRRHQKVIEEAPPPGLAPVIRKDIEAAAVRLARAVEYEGVGTVEFLQEGDEFTFLEVNPRLQVEHGITEALTGLDLVELQIRIARGDSLEDISVAEQGVAFEARVCAEDPDAGFLPSPGRIVRFEPGLGPRVRVDSGVALGSQVPPDFDSLVAKVIAHGETREDARARLVCALRDFELVVEGGASNKGYLIDILETPAFRAGPVDTRWLDRWNEERGRLGDGHQARLPEALLAAGALAYQRNRALARRAFYADTTAISRERVPRSRGQEIDLAYGGDSYRLQVYAIGSWRYRIHLDGVAVTVLVREDGDNAARIEIGGASRRILYDITETHLRVEIDGHPVVFGLTNAGQVSAGTPATVVAVHVSPGDRVEAGQNLGLLEAMKMEIGFQAPVSGTVKEVRVRPGEQVAAGSVLLAIEVESEGEQSSSSGRLKLPELPDPLAQLFRATRDEPLGEPDLARAASAQSAAREDAISTLREEIRRVLLGYDANPARAERLVALLEAPLPRDLSEEFRLELESIRDEITTFADIERLFIRAPRASVSGELGPSNNARLRMYIRRLQAEGDGIADEFLELVQRALAHYGVTELKDTGALRRAILRLLSSELAPELRRRLLLGMLRHVTALAESGIEMGGDARLAESLDRIARMRGLLPDAIADAAIEARYVIFERPALEWQAEHSSKDLESWLQAAEAAPTAPSEGVLMEVAAAARRVFDRVGGWIAAPDPGHRDIALAAHLQRVYAPRPPGAHRQVREQGNWIHTVEYEGLGRVLAATARVRSVPSVAQALCECALRLETEVPGVTHALELVVPLGARTDPAAVAARLEQSFVGKTLPCRLSLALVGEDAAPIYKTLEDGPEGPKIGENQYDLHPEVAERLDIQRLRAFELERLPSDEGIYAFHGKSRDVAGDERVFVLADVQSHSAGEGHEVEPHLPAFERAFNQATRCLRTNLQVRDPGRRLQWNRIALFVAPEIFLDPDTASALARRLAPATRHLGLEKVLVRLNLLKRDSPGERAEAVELVITQPTGEQMELAWRTAHHAPLEPAQDYERRVVAARRRRLVYPYEIVRMLTSGEKSWVEGEDATLPSGEFFEYDLEEVGGVRRAVPVDRPPARNVAAVVFGLIDTPTEKWPDGMRRVLLLSDPTMEMGSLSAPECDRIVAAIDLAEEKQLPVEWVPVSSGARIAMDSGTENLDATARVVRRIVTFTQQGGSIHVIVQGVNVGAQSYFDALSTMLMHNRGVLIMTPRASMVLTGRAALEASGAVSAEDEVAIGGFERIMGPNGQAQYYARSLADAYRILYDYYRYSYVFPGEKTPRRLATRDPKERVVGAHSTHGENAMGFESVGEIFDAEANPGRKRPFAMRAVMEGLIDADGGHLERWRPMVGAETAIVWDAHLGGFPITLIGIESHNVAREGYRPIDGPESWTGGTLFPLSSKKVARALNAASGNRAAVILANLSGFDGSPESLRKLQLEYGAEIARAVVNFEGPLLFLVVSRYHGGAYVVFSQELNDSLEALALEGSYASVIGGGPAASVVFGREVRKRAIADPRVQECEQELRTRPSRSAREKLEATLSDVTLEKQAEIAAEFDRIHDVERAREVGSLSRIIPAEEMRPALIACLEQAGRV